jgi:hypothetical protein
MARLTTATVAMITPERRRAARCLIVKGEARAITDSRRSETGVSGTTTPLVSVAGDELSLNGPVAEVKPVDREPASWGVGVACPVAEGRPAGGPTCRRAGNFLPQLRQLRAIRLLIVPHSTHGIKCNGEPHWLQNFEFAVLT